MNKKLLQAIKEGNTHYFYTSRTWRKKRLEILDRDNNECQKCKKRGEVSKATCVHHKKHLKDRPDLALEDNNLESLCDTCHNEEHPEKLNNPKPKRKFVNEERW